MFKNSILLIAAFLAITTAPAAEARHRHAHHKRGAEIRAVITCNVRGCSDRGDAAHAEVTPVVDANGNGAIVGRRPTGCPHAFCGCEASRYLFGEIRPELNLAANWIRKFPRTQPAPGMAAARSHHVMVLMSHVDGSEWLVHDGNSGGGLTREHVQSIRGYVIVDPNGSRSASR